MQKSICVAFCLCLMMCLTQSALATSTIGDISTASTNGSSGHPIFGQTFQVPAGENGVTSVSLAVRRGTSGVVDGALQLYDYNESTNAFVGGPLFSSNFSAVLGEQTVTRLPNLAVAPGETLALVTKWSSNTPGDVGGFYRTDSYYAGGHTLFSDSSAQLVSFPNYDMAFQVAFGTVPEPATLLIVLPITLLVRRPRHRTG